MSAIVLAVVWLTIQTSWFLASTVVTNPVVVRGVAVSFSVTNVVLIVTLLLVARTGAA